MESIALASIVAEHNLKADPRTREDHVGPAQRFALEVLRDPAVPFDPWELEPTAVVADLGELAQAVMRRQATPV